MRLAVSQPCSSQRPYTATSSAEGLGLYRIVSEAQHPAVRLARFDSRSVWYQHLSTFIIDFIGRLLGVTCHSTKLGTVCLSAKSSTSCR